MKRYNLLLIPLVILLFITSAFAQDMRPDKSELRIMSWNVRFMWDGVPPEEGRIVSKTPEEAQAHMQAIAREIKQYSPDMVNLVEVENKAALKALNSLLQGQGYEAHLKKGIDTYTGQDVGLLSRLSLQFPIDRYAAKGQSGDVQKSVSKNYYALFEIGDLKLALISLHFLSVPTDSRKLHKRQAQASAMAQLANQLIGHGYEVVMLGDFNDYDGVVPDIQNNRPITRVLDICKLKMDIDPANDLVNIAQYVHQKNRYTAHYDKDKDGRVDGKKELSSIDHILVSQGLVGRIKAAGIIHHKKILEISDHFPLMVVLDTTGH